MVDTIRVLVVDDEAIIRHMLDNAMQETGWQIDMAETAEAALELCKNRSFDLHIIDKNLPDMSGVELARRIRESNERAACIIITAYATAESARESLRFGIDDYVVKPFGDLLDLRDKLTRVVERRKGRFAAVGVPTPAGQRRLSIVVGSPDKADQQWLADYFDSLGDTVTCVSTASAVVDQVQAGTVDLLIVDTGLREPDINTLLIGLETMPNAPPTVVLARPNPLLREVIDYINLNVRAVIDKPLSKEGFLRETDALIRFLRS